MKHKTFIWFFLPSALAMFLFIAMPIVSVLTQSVYAPHEQVIREVENCSVFGCVKSTQIDQEATRELREAGERCSRHRVRRLMKAEGIRAGIGYGTKPRHRGGPRGMVENVVNRDFSPAAPNKVWVTDITYI